MTKGLLSCISVQARISRVGLLVALLASCASPQITNTTTTADLVITYARVYTAPGKQALDRHTLVIKDGQISILRATQPNDAQIKTKQSIDARGKTLVAGLWNSHVHFTPPELGEDPQSVIIEMLLRRGFTHVVDTGSVLEETLALRSAIRNGELRGPHIVLANGSFVYTNGTPSYLPGFSLPEVSNPAAAAPMVERVLNAGADGIKIFTGSFQSPIHTIHLPANIVAAITRAAKARNRFVMAHPTTIEGLTIAVRGGVDVIAHTTPPEIDIPNRILEKMRAQNTALIPTLALWRYEMQKFGAPIKRAELMENAALAQLRALNNAHIEILFGTDVGYKTDFDTTTEYRLMQAAGMDWPAIHRSLTTAPAERFGVFTGGGVRLSRIEVGAPANIVLLDGDPAEDIEALARVALTVIDGAVVYRALEGVK